MTPGRGPGDERLRALRLALGAAAVLYAMGHLLWYGNTPLGRVPLLDAHELLEMARQIADGALPHEPFYRAPLYPAVLSLPLRLGLDPAWLPAAARALNFLSHLAAACALARIARLLGASPLAALATFVLWAVYPVALHLAGDAFDITFALALALWGVALLLACVEERSAAAPRRACAGGLLLGLAVAARPNLLPIALAGVGLLALAAWRLRRDPRPGLGAATGLAAALLALGLASLLHGGEFRVLPWQGPYNLWAANRPEAHGRYYEQLIEIRNLDAHRNPNRAESEVLYRAEVPGGEATIDAMNRHWRDRFVARVRADPMGWAAFVLRRGFYLLNDFEQYDNTTYHVQRRASPWLRWNALGFGALLVLAALGAVARRQDRLVRVHLLLAASYLGGALLFYASDRFRLPLAAMLVPLAALAPQAFRAGWRASAPAATAAASAALIAFWPLPAALREATVHNDLMLEAQAELEVGEYEPAERHAEAALALDPRPSFGWELLCAARYDLVLARLPDELPAGADRRGLAACLAPAARSDRARALGGVFQWRTGARDPALDAWRALAAADSPAASDACAFLVLARALPGAPAPSCLRGHESGVAQVLLALLGDTAAAASLPPGTNLARERARLERLLLGSEAPATQ